VKKERRPKAGKQLAANADPAELDHIAERLDMLSERQLTVAAQATPGTAESWRKHRNGPPFVRFGNAYFYPRDGVIEFLKSRIRVPRSVEPSEVI
jgi:hypothetical protein